MNIEKHISGLLFRYECVVIPGFGGMISSHCPAMLQNDERLFYPPSKFLAFNKNLNKHDGLLANYVADKEKISYNDAILQIEFFVRSITGKLNKGERVSLVHIGTFSTDKEKNILFTPDEQINYLTASFGLSSFYASPINRKENIEFANNKSSRGIIRRLFPSRVRGYQVAMAASVVLFVSAWLPFNYTSEPRNLNYSSLNTFSEAQKPLTKAEASFSDSQPLKDNDLVEANLPETDVNAPVNIPSPTNAAIPVTEESKEEKVLKPEVHNGISKNHTINSPISRGDRGVSKNEVVFGDAHKAVNKKISSKKFYIIAGVFSQKENAEKMITTLNKDGFFNALIVDKNKKGLYRVAFNSYTDEDEAEYFLQKIKSDKKRSAWILSK